MVENEDSTESQDAGEVADQLSPLSSCIEKAFGESKYSDLSVHCGGRTWRVHRIIVCSQASFFDKACSSGFKEEASGELKLGDDDPNVVNEMLRYLYTADYIDQSENTEEEAAHSALVMNVLVHTIADKYDIPALCKLATNKFAARAAREWNTGPFASAMEEIHTVAEHTKKEMQKIVVDIASEHAEQLFHADYGSKFRKVAETVPKFAAELAVRIIDKKEPDGESRYRCPTEGCEKQVCLETIASNDSTNRACPYCLHQCSSRAWRKNVCKARK